MYQQLLNEISNELTITCNNYREDYTLIKNQHHNVCTFAACSLNRLKNIGTMESKNYNETNVTIGLLLIVKKLQTELTKSQDDKLDSQFNHFVAKWNLTDLLDKIESLDMEDLKEHLTENRVKALSETFLENELPRKITDYNFLHSDIHHYLRKTFYSASFNMQVRKYLPKYNLFNNTALFIPQDVKQIINEKFINLVID